MAKAPLNWHKINLSTSAKELADLLAVETKATEATNAAIRKLAAAHEKVSEANIRVGRMYGAVSYAVDMTMTGASAAVSLGGKPAKD